MASDTAAARAKSKRQPPRKPNRYIALDRMPKELSRPVSLEIRRLQARARDGELLEADVAKLEKLAGVVGALALARSRMRKDISAGAGSDGPDASKLSREELERIAGSESS